MDFNFMTIPYTIEIHQMPDYYHFYLHLQPEFINVSAIIIDAGNIEGQKSLLHFVKDVIDGNNNKNEYWTNGYTAKVIKNEDKILFKIYFRLTEDYPPCYVDVVDFKELLEIWISERMEFEKDTEAYKEKLKRI